MLLFGARFVISGVVIQSKSVRFYFSGGLFWPGWNSWSITNTWYFWIGRCFWLRLVLDLVTYIIWYPLHITNSFSSITNHVFWRFLCRANVFLNLYFCKLF
ncbi:hypothetical protein KFK09_004768 [Dendrobium nobile]|uniref:Uncharacterized protein n=1 Tax=Dendrobium nobile TaxID=94219 RepID=A0A8T3BYV1_DENNO|nr:hypothetical protein KFK09_004768 [Dendrobium nobile]